MPTAPSGFRIPSSAWIWIAILISAASNSIVAKLHDLGACHLAPDGKNPISFCNIFFTGSVVAFFTLFLTHPKEVRPTNLRGYSTQEWWLTLISAALAGARARGSGAGTGPTLPQCWPAALLRPRYLACQCWLPRCGDGAPTQQMGQGRGVA